MHSTVGECGSLRHTPRGAGQTCLSTGRWRPPHQGLHRHSCSGQEWTGCHPGYGGLGCPQPLPSSLLPLWPGPDPMAQSRGWSGPGRPRRPQLQVQHPPAGAAGPLAAPRPGWKHSLLGHMISTKNSQGFPMAFWKDWRLPVSSGGTAASSRTGGPPGGPPTTEYAFVSGCSGGSPGAAAEAWLRGLLPRLSWLAGRSRQPPLPTPLGTVWSDSLPLPPAPADRLSFSRPRARRLLPPALRVDPLLLLPGVKKGGEEWDGQCQALPLPRQPAIAKTTRGRTWWS